jgi:hypothetical protein
MWMCYAFCMGVIDGIFGSSRQMGKTIPLRIARNRAKARRIDRRRMRSGWGRRQKTYKPIF